MKDPSYTTNDETISVFLHYIIYTIITLSCIYICIHIIYDYSIGGNSWKQGDWLINNISAPVRRGWLGSSIIWISDHLLVSPLIVVATFQIFFIISLYFVFFILLAHVQNANIKILLMLSPAIFAIIWVADPQGSARKELISFLGISLYALGASRKNRVALWIGVIIFSISTASHEAMVLFLPTFFILTYVTGLYRSSKIHAISSVSFVVVASVAAVTFALKNSQVADVGAICAPLIERGLNKSICDGAIAWLDRDISYGVSFVAYSFDIRSGIEFLIAYVISLLPLLYVIYAGEKRLFNLFLLVVIGMQFSPLYFVSVDWGRWISFHVFSATIIISCVMARSTPSHLRNIPILHVLLLLTLSLLASPQHKIGIIWGGAARRAASEFWRLLG